MKKKNEKTILDRLDNVELKMLQDTEYAKEYLTEEGVDIEEEQELAAKYIRKMRSIAIKEAEEILN